MQSGGSFRPFRLAELPSPLPSLNFKNHALELHVVSPTPPRSRSGDENVTIWATGQGSTARSIMVITRAVK